MGTSWVPLAPCLALPKDYLRDFSGIAFCTPHGLLAWLPMPRGAIDALDIFKFLSYRVTLYSLMPGYTSVMLQRLTLGLPIIFRA